MLSKSQGFLAQNLTLLHLGIRMWPPLILNSIDGTFTFHQNCNKQIFKTTSRN